nr:zinc finger, CCHC-type [Tanacetum cinerariifolium]
MTTTVVNNLVFRAFFEKQKLYGPNFIDWCQQLRLFLSAKDKLNYLELLIPAAPVLAVVGQPVPPETLAAHAAWVKGQKEIFILMLMTMELDLQRNLENLLREFHACKKEEGKSISSYVLNMKSYIDNLEHLGHLVSLSLVVSLILISLRKEYDSFVKNYNMHSMGKTNKKLPQGASTSGIFTIELFTFPGKSLVYDTGRGTLCNTTQGLRRSRKLKAGALSLYMNNGQRAAVEATGSYDLYFQSGLVIVLHNCRYAPSITRGVISVSRLNGDGLIKCFKNDNLILVPKNNLIYFNVILRDGIFENVLSNSNTIDRFMYVVSNKRAKLNLDSSLLWHCRLGYISKKHIKKLKHDRLLNSIDTKSFEKYVSCLSGKMARKPYSHQVERAKDLLGLIHTNVCVPFKIVS